MLNTLHRQGGGLAAEFNSGRNQSWFEDFDSAPTAYSPLAAFSGDSGIQGGDTWMLPGNVTYASSMATLTIKQEASNGKTYTGPRLSSYRRRSITYGRLDIRARYAYGSGLWWAIWLLPTWEHWGQWPRGGEIDILDHPGPGASEPHANNEYSCGLHFGTAFGDVPPGQSKFSIGAPITGWNTYSLIWEPSRFVWLANDNVLRTVSTWTVPAGGVWPNPFNAGFFLMIDGFIAPTGWSGAPQGTSFPQSSDIDWVRYTPL
jgi:beta-glucanase (GH16 family)